MSFANKVVIVTGTSSGTGAVTAVLFAEQGADVAIVARRKPKLEEVTKKIQALGRKALVITADLSKESEVANIVRRTVQHFGKLDILVNNAGMNGPAALTSDKIKQSYDPVMQTNVRAVIQLTSLATPHLVKTKGNVVNISSAASLTVGKVPGIIVYQVSKAALDHFTRCAALELGASSGVRVNGINPGPVDNDFAANNGYSDRLNREKRVAVTALGYMATNEEIGGVILFLASDKAKSVTGSN